MELILATSLFFSSLIYGSVGQTCNPNLPSQCYYTGAGTISAGDANNNGYFAIGGLFDIHKKGDNGYCGDFSTEGMLNLLAFYWSVDEFSKTILANKPMRVGAIAFDNCMRPDQTVENVLSFSQCKVQVQGLNQQNVVGYVGPYTNQDTVRTGMLAEDLNLVVISPTANSLDLVEQKTLLRMKPSIETDIKAILAFLKSYPRFNFLSVVYSKDKYWTEVYEKVKEMLEADDSLCNVYRAGLAESATDAEIKVVADTLIRNRNTRFILPLMSKEMINKLMEATKQNAQDLVYLLNSNIGQDESFVDIHSIIVEPSAPTTNDINRFNDYLRKVNTNATLYANLGRTDVINPWLQAYIKDNNMFTILDRNVPSRMRLSIANTIESVRHFIEGMDRAIGQLCSSGGNYQLCDDLRNTASQRNNIFSFVKGTGFGDNNVPDVEYSYYVYNHDYVKIGTYKPSSNEVTITNSSWIVDSGNVFNGATCNINNQEIDCCVKTTTAPPTTMAPATTTPQTATLRPNNLVVAMYPKGKEITGAFSDESRDSKDDDTRFDIDQKWIIALGVLAGLGVLCVLVFEIFILYKMMGKGIHNKWRTMWLGQLMLFGLLLSYLVCFAYIPIPTKATCGITRFGVGVSYAICFSVLLVKLMVILTSKTSEALIPGDVESPNYLKGVYQFLMFVFAVGVQVVISIQWLITVPPEAVKVISNTGKPVWMCNHYTWETGKNMLKLDEFVRTNFENHLMSLVYIMVLILIVTVLSLNAHGIITNHRESVFIGISAGFSIPLWLAWGLVGGLNKDHDYGHEFGDACMAFGLFLNATLILFTMFLPKVRQLVNMGVEGIYLEDDRDTIYGGSVIMGPPSFKSKGPSSVIYVNNQGIYAEPVVVGNGDAKSATHLKHAGSTYSAPPAYLKKTDSTYGGSRVLRVTDDLKGRHPQKPRKPLSEVAYSSSGKPKSQKGTLPRSRSQSDLGAL